MVNAIWFYMAAEENAGNFHDETSNKMGASIKPEDVHAKGIRLKLSF